MSPPTKKLGVKTNQGVLSFVYTCIAVRDPIIKRDWDRINRLNPATCLRLFQARTKTHVCACSKPEPRDMFAPVPRQNQDFQRHMSW